MWTVRQEVPRTRPGTVEECEIISTIAGDLLALGLPTAPHVIGKLLRRLDGDAVAVRETAKELAASQRSGQRMLPRLLPLVPSVARSFEDLALDADDRRVLLFIAISIDDSLHLLLSASRRTVEGLATGDLGAHLSISHGRCRFTDQRMGTWLERTASTLELSEAHQRMSEAHRERGEHESCAWHAARGALERNPRVAAPLISAAGELNESGDADRAFIVAVEAADHAEGRERDEARLIAGTAAVGAGCFEDAADWLGSLCPQGDESLRRRALASLLLAETYAHGVVPAISPAERRPRTPDPRRWREWARTAGLAAVMCAERGRAAAMRTWLAEVREADARAGAAGRIREPVVALCWILTGEAVDDEVRSSGPLSGGVVGALCAAVSGDIDHGLQLLACAASAQVSESDPLVTGSERSPLVGAYLAVAEALLHFWRGDVATARERLLAASLTLPVGPSFAGLGAALARRLDITSSGALGVLAQALTETLPGGTRIDRLVDRGLTAYLKGAGEQADTEITLWHDRGAPESALSLPGLDEVGPIVDRPRVEPPEMSVTRRLLARLRRLPESSWRAEHAAIAEAGRDLVSSFSRGRVEAMLGFTCVIHDDAPAGRRHLRAARRLFEDAGALAWRDAVDARIARPAPPNAVSDTATTQIDSLHGIDPVERSRVVWSAILKNREVDVAMRVVEGHTNGEIAAALDISVRTVEVHVGRILSTLGVRNRVQLTALAHRTGRVF